MEQKHNERQIAMNNHYPFELPALPYAYDALEPYLYARILQLHHDRHFKNYVDGLNRALEDYPAYHSWTLERLIRDNCRLPFQIQAAVWQNAGGVFNHAMYFDIIAPPAENQSVGSRLYEAVISAFGSEEEFFAKLKECSLSQLGSGWGWLTADRRGRLRIINTPNQDTPLSCDLCPIIPLDVWEHAYYLQYENRRADYIDAFFHILNFAVAEKNYLACFSRTSVRRE